MRGDFHFLTDVERVADTAHREAKLMLRPQLPNHLKNLVRQASLRRRAANHACRAAAPQGQHDLLQPQDQ